MAVSGAGESIEIPWVALARLPYHSEPVVEIDALEASTFNGFRKLPIKNHRIYG
jgi:hypothetical protein